MILKMFINFGTVNIVLYRFPLQLMRVRLVANAQGVRNSAKINLNNVLLGMKIIIWLVFAKQETRNTNLIHENTTRLCVNQSNLALIYHELTLKIIQGDLLLALISKTRRIYVTNAFLIFVTIST